MNIIEQYLKKPYWVIDILPKQVPANGRGQYFKIEKYWRMQPQFDLLCQKFNNLLIKLNCYYDISVHFDEEWTVNPFPDQIKEWMSSRKPVYVLLESGNAMIAFNGDDHYITLYHPDMKLLELIIPLAITEGLFAWKPDGIG
ncbi:MAG: hypothetical protein II050_07340 [Bacteroidaceae bacterium]|nr:hypothetical protein [Bacteroidaceae bacterium]